MVDGLNTPQADEVTPAIESTDSAASRRSWLSEHRNIAMMAAAGAVLVAVVIVVFLYLGSAGNTDDDAGLVPVQPGSTESTQVVGQVEEPEEPSLTETFAFRNIFMPSVKAPAEPDSDDGGSGDGSGTGSNDGSSDSDVTSGPGELVLVSIQSEGGTREATFSWSGQTYTLGKGDVIPDTPWRVVAISANSVSVIYGDSSPIELTIGSSITK